MVRTLGLRKTLRRFTIGVDLQAVESVDGDQRGPTIGAVSTDGRSVAVLLTRTAYGFEAHMGTNHLGHFALTCQLGDKITDRVMADIATHGKDQSCPRPKPG
jgi:hypothetical protein